MTLGVELSEFTVIGEFGVLSKSTTTSLTSSNGSHDVIECFANLAEWFGNLIECFVSLTEWFDDLIECFGNLIERFVSASLGRATEHPLIATFFFITFVFALLIGILHESRLFLDCLVVFVRDFKTEWRAWLEAFERLVNAVR